MSNVTPGDLITYSIFDAASQLFISENDVHRATFIKVDYKKIISPSILISVIYTTNFRDDVIKYGFVLRPDISCWILL